MSEIDDLLAEFPAAARERLRAAWDRVPAPAREHLARGISALPGNLGGWRSLVRLALSQARLATGRKGRVAIVGPANVGKSTLYNQLIREGEDRAEVSPIPGTTRTSQAADAGLFVVVDTPGADAVGAVGEAEKDRATASAREADFLVVVFDAALGIKRSEHALFQELQGLDRPCIVVLNKIDLVPGPRERKRVVGAAARNLGLSPDQVVPCAAKNGTHLDRILLAIAKADPETVAALGQALPAYRRQLARSATTKAGATAAVIALSPLPILDVFPLVAVQAFLVLGIARIYGERLTLARTRELLPSFGLGLAGRTLFYELSKLGGPPGWVLAAAIASSTTAVIGEAAAAWFEHGTRPRSTDLRARARGLAQRLRDSLRNLGRRRPGSDVVRREVEAVLEGEPLAEHDPRQP
jgi:small GTP-binding protein